MLSRPRIELFGRLAVHRLVNDRVTPVDARRMISATFDAIALLLADRSRPNTLPLQASVLVKPELEALGNVLALMGNPKAIKWFLADGFVAKPER